MSDTIVMPLLAEASHRLALAQHLAKADVAEEGVEFAAAALNRLQADTRLAKHVSDAGIWVAELSEDLPDALRWDRSLEARCGLLATELGELAALIELPTKAAKPRCQHHPRIHVPDGLRTMREAAARLGCSVKTLKAHIASGVLGYVVIGHGSKRPRKMFTDADINQFIANQTRKDVPVCPSSPTSARRTINTTSSSEVIAFTALPRPRPSGKPKK